MDATDLRLKDTGEVITDKEWKRAVDCIIKNHREDLPELKKVIEEKGKGWSLGYHRSLGLSVRNTLRREGFHWGAISLDDNWADLVEEAVKKVSRAV
jgi:hypothetical protein